MTLTLIKKTNCPSYTKTLWNASQEKFPFRTEQIVAAEPVEREWKRQNRNKKKALAAHFASVCACSVKMLLPIDTLTFCVCTYLFFCRKM